MTHKLCLIFPILTASSTLLLWRKEEAEFRSHMWHSELRLNLAGMLTWLAQPSTTWDLQKWVQEQYRKTLSYLSAAWYRPFEHQGPQKYRNWPAKFKRSSEWDVKEHGKRDKQTHSCIHPALGIGGTGWIGRGGMDPIYRKIGKTVLHRLKPAS